eukprot:3826416-Prymnesium_polylepis.1
MADDVARRRCRVATRALRCLWHEIRVDERTNNRTFILQVVTTSPPRAIGARSLEPQLQNGTLNSI